MFHHRVTATIALTTALAVTTAPVASADQQPLAQAEAAIANASSHGQPNRGTCSETCSDHGYGTVDLTSVVPASTGPSSEVVSGGGYGTAGAPATVLRVVAPDAGFNWGDAGIGAGSMLALTLIGVGGAIGATSRRGRHTQQQPTSPSV